MANLFTLLPLLQKLFPNPLEPLLPAASLKNKGKKSLAQRKQHTEKAGTEWFSTGELDLMLSILASDVQEDSFSSLLPCDLGPLSTVVDNIPRTYNTSDISLNPHDNHNNKCAHSPAFLRSALFCHGSDNLNKSSRTVNATLVYN